MIIKKLLLLNIIFTLTACFSTVRQGVHPGALTIITISELSVIETTQGFLGKRKAVAYVKSGLICGAQVLGPGSAESKYKYDIPIGTQLTLASIKIGSGCSIFFGECSADEYPFFELPNVGLVDGSEFYCFGKLNGKIVQEI